ncbi:GIY-YIG nuclease family protein [Chenggangzhangella methanolivorans]|uniref:GIY-YIG nuclease family protein n=1 Tax=Chenggangzhangella methanolivorans TaxID=1437009 RepID=A0A9E6RCB7_9HYPH|nr:GIY-YIG nuclease family protein [Chenggangzhangella methanolivorans]QZO02186.1 GIY-YIG nuclease family protein [Chenggangzhangella methanolivorans]
MEKRFFVYILATRKDGPLYVGVTSDLPGRIAQHKAKVVRGFTEKFNVDRLVWFEAHEGAEAAIVREKQIKRWRRDWKTELIETSNPDWRDLYDEMASF